MKKAVEDRKQCFTNVFMISDELAIDVREVEEEEERSGGQREVAPAEETL